MRQPSIVRTTAALCMAAASLQAAAGEPRGPEFGASRFTAAIDAPGAETDVDDYVATLAAGDALSVTVVAEKQSALLPALSLVAPDGSPVTPEVAVKAGGRQVTLKSFAVPSTGRWGVRIAGTDATEGPYGARFSVKPAKAAKQPKTHLGGTDPLVASHAFEAAAGSTLTFTVKPAGKGAPLAVRALLGPDGREVPDWDDALVAKRGAFSAKGVELPLSGTYRLDVGIDSGEANCAVKLGVAPPARPKGKRAFDEEPWLAGRSSPLEGTGGQPVKLTGLGFDVFRPFPKVWFGDQPATVIAAGAGGVSLDVVPPDAPGDSVVDVTVQNADGQTTTRPGYFHYVALGPLEIASLTPGGPLRIAQGAQQTFTITMTRVVQPPGIDIPLTVTGPLGSISPTVRVLGLTASATFHLDAGQTLASGRIEAAYGNTVGVDVEIVPPGAVASIEPAEADLLYGQEQLFTIRLSSAAPTAGADVTLTWPSALGSLPATVRVPGGATSATAKLVAGSKRTTGTVKASLNGDVFANVDVTAPDRVDMSNWTIVVTNTVGAAQETFTIPEGTLLDVTDCIVVGTASSSAFQSAWNTTFDLDHVVYFDGGSFPPIDGYERVIVRDADGNDVDLRTVQMGTGGTLMYVRNPGQAADEYASWLAYSSININNAPRPGSGGTPSASFPGIYVSKFCDAPSGAYDFVEIYFDELP